MVRQKNPWLKKHTDTHTHTHTHINDTNKCTHTQFTQTNAHTSKVHKQPHTLTDTLTLALQDVKFRVALFVPT